MIPSSECGGKITLSQELTTMVSFLALTTEASCDEVIASLLLSAIKGVLKQGDREMNLQLSDLVDYHVWVADKGFWGETQLNPIRVLRIYTRSR